MKKWNLSHPQERILVTHFLHENMSVCNIGGYAFFEGDVNFDKLKEAMFKTIQSMDCFSIKIEYSENQYVQLFSNNIPQMSIMEEENGSEQELKRLAQRTIEIPFSLKEKYLYRAILWKGRNCSGYILVAHHIICDGWSMNLFAEQVTAFYNGEEKILYSYTEFLTQENEYMQSLAAQKDFFYWNEFLKDNYFPEKIGEHTQNRCEGWREEYCLTGTVKDKLIEAGKKYGSINVVLCACFASLDILEGGNGVIGIPCYNRIGKRMRRVAGMFTSTTMSALRCSFRDSLCVSVAQMKRDLLKSIFHQRWPYDRLDIINGKEPFNYNINCYNSDMTYSLAGISGTYTELYPGAQAQKNQVILNTWKADWTLKFDFQENFYHKGDGEKYINFLNFYLIALLEDDRITFEQLAQRWKNMIYFVNHSAEKITCVKLSFFDRLRRLLYPGNDNRTAVVLTDKSISRDQLASYIKNAIRYYQDNGLKIGDSIIIWLENSLEYIVYVFAAASMGICFTPLDITTSYKQVKYFYRDTDAKALVTHNSEENADVTVLIPVLCTENFEIDIPRIREQTPLYLIYTSGSSGSPKGVLVSRGALENYLNWAEVFYGSNKKFFLYSSPSFDLSLTALFLPLMTDGEVIIGNKDTKALYQLPSLPNVEMVDTIKATPSNIALLLSGNTDKLKLKTIICGGEELSFALAEKMRKKFGMECNIYNEYGPTECTIGCMCAVFDEKEGNKSSVSIGKAAPGCSIFISKDMENLCAPGETGEIFIAGEQLAIGYWKMPLETNEKFLNNKFGVDRVYRSGDLGRYKVDGKVEFLGRRDKQIKLNGYRVEIESIENIIKNLPGVTNAVAWVEKRENDYLVVAVEGDSRLQGKICDAICGQLPEYCIPHKFIFFDILPTTINGKPDVTTIKRKLDKQIDISNAKEALESALRRVLDYHGEMDEFDYILEGGDSIQAIRVVAMLQKYGYRLSMADLLNHPRFDEMLFFMYQEENENDRIAFPMPNHLKYLVETCQDFTKYFHIIKVELRQKISISQMKLLNSQLIDVFPALRISMVNNTLLYDKEALPSLFKINLENEENRCVLKIEIHHVLVDGLSWYQILNVIKKCLEGEKIQKRPLLEIWKMDNELKYHWSSYQYDILSEMVEEEFILTKEDTLDIEDFIDIIRAMIESVLDAKKSIILCEWDGRKIVSLRRSDNIGCYSIFIPIFLNGKSTKEQIGCILKEKKVSIPFKEVVRVNYLGNLDRIIPLGMSVMPESFAESRILCSAWGCEFEITAYTYLGKMHVIAGTRITNNYPKINRILQFLKSELSKDSKTYMGYSLDDLESFGEL